MIDAPYPSPRVQNIKDSGADLTPFTQAAADGLEWIG